MLNAYVTSELRRYVVFADSDRRFVDSYALETSLTVPVVTVHRRTRVFQQRPRENHRSRKRRTSYGISVSYGFR